MNEKLTRRIAPLGLLLGAILGMVGSFVPSASVRGLAWGIDGAGIIVRQLLTDCLLFSKRL
jgi:uncharacterized membrane protein YeaQ/YmgE (transglycosylase-associated protein family)